MSIRSTQNERNIQARKSSVLTIGKGKPLDARGNEGDLTFRRTSGGLKLYIKANHKWHGIKVGESFDSLEKKIDEIKLKINALKLNKLPSTYSTTEDLTLDVAGDIVLSADGDQITMDDGTTTRFTFNVDSTPELDVTGDFILDCSGDIEINADGGQVTIKDATNSHFKFDCDNTRFVVWDDANQLDAFTITVGVNSSTTIATVDNVGTLGHLTLLSNGDLILDPDSQKIIINATDKLYFDGGGNTYIVAGVDILDFYVGDVNLLKLTEAGGGASDKVSIPAATPFYLDGGTETYIHEVSADKMELVVGGDEMLTLDEDNQRITLEADKLVYKLGSGGDEFSVADSAYAGMILGYKCLGHDAGRVLYTLTTSFVTLNAEAFVRFIAPPSGVAEIFVQAGLLDAASGRYVYFGLSDNATYNTLGAQHEEFVHMSDETDQQIIQNNWVISGLTAGDTYTYWFGLKGNHPSSGVLSYGGTGSGHYSPFIMKVTALPTAIADFAEYD